MFCETCKDPIGDSEAIIVSGVQSGKRYLVHRPTTPDKAMCFRWGVNGAAQQSIQSKVTLAVSKARELWDIRLALEVGLDQPGCESAGVSWDAVRAARTAARRRR